MSQDKMMRDYGERQMRGMQNTYLEQTAQVGGLGPITKAMSPVECEMQGLSESIGILHKRLSTLEDKLRPVLHERNDKPQPGVPPCEPTTGVPLANEIRSLCDSATSLRNRMDDIIERVAV